MLRKYDKRTQEQLMAIFPTKRQEIHRAIKSIITEHSSDYEEEVISLIGVLEKINLNSLNKNEKRNVIKRFNIVKKKYNTHLDGCTYTIVNAFKMINSELASNGMSQWEAYEIALMYPEKKDLLRQYIGSSYISSWISRFGKEELIKTRKYFAKGFYDAVKWLDIFERLYGRNEEFEKHRRYFSRKLGRNITL